MALALAGAVLLTACASPDTTRLRPLAEREADLYPVAQTRAGVTVAIDPLDSATRTEQYFATNLRRAGILPIHVIVSNHGSRRLVTGPADILLVRDRDVIDPLPLETVIDTIKRENTGLPGRAERSIDEYVVTSSFQQTGIGPGATVRGLLYFPVARVDDRSPDRYWNVTRLFRGDDELSVRVGLTDADTNDRIRFGPLPVDLR